MKKKANIIFSNFSIQEDLSFDDIYNTIEESTYSNEKGFGYTNTEINNSILYSTLIKRTITSIMEYDIAINNFKKIEIPVFDEISFSIDYNKNLLYCFGSSSNLNKIKTAIRNTFNVRFIYNDLKVTPVTIMERIIANSINFEINEVIIKRFEYKKGINGRFVAQISDQKMGKNLIEDYINEIQKISLCVIEDEEYHLIISSNNTLAIKCEEDDFYSILENIKNKIYA